MRNSKSVAFSTCFTHTRTPYTCIQSCTHSSQTQRQHSCVSLWLWDGEKGKEKERKKERERERGRESSCWWGWTEPLQRHTDRSLWKERITCARLLSCHILIPGRAHLGTNFTPLRHRAPQQSPPSPPPVIQPCSCQHFHLCAAVVWCQVHTSKHTHTHTHSHTHTLTFSPKPPQQLACLMSVKNTRWGGEDGGLTLWRYVGLCALHFYCYLREKKKKSWKKRERNTI